MILSLLEEDYIKLSRNVTVLRHSIQICPRYMKMLQEFGAEIWHKTSGGMTHRVCFTTRWPHKAVCVTLNTLIQLLLDKLQSCWQTQQVFSCFIRWCRAQWWVKDRQTDVLLIRFKNIPFFIQCCTNAFSICIFYFAQTYCPLVTSSCPS